MFARIKIFLKWLFLTKILIRNWHASLFICLHCKGIDSYICLQARKQQELSTKQVSIYAVAY